MDTQTFAQAYAKFYENLSKDSTKEDYGVFFDKHSEFEDPFQKLKGLDAIHNIFVDMYKKLHNPHFIIDEVVSDGEVAYIRWDFKYALSSKAKEESFRGLTRVTFTASAKVKTHIDYWDAGKNVYEKIPVLGFFIRLIKRKLHA